MDSQLGGEVSESNRMLFGAGFVFGVTCTMLVLAVVIAGVGGGEVDLGAPVMLTIGAGIVFTAIVGTALYLLAFPENRLRIPVGPDEE
ncbi:MAG: hypothetical protein ABEH35_08545 [Haloarculaceae archaeon]